MAQFRKDTHKFLEQEKTLFETVMIADQYGNLVGAANPSGAAVDAFGRARVSQPLTLFDSFHRYQDNGKIGTANSATGSSYRHDANSSSIICSVGTSNGNYVYRESNRVFAYQPGKSLQVLETFVMAPAQTGLRQRYGFFGTENGFFLEQDGHNVYFVKRSKSTGTIQETRVAQANWNVDTLLGDVNSSPSKITLDLSKAQILWTDIEWLGVGSVRCGFVIDGQFIHCHTWNHANVLDITYMSTACLPIRCEIENTANTSNTSNLRVICATVISEGGYEPRGRQRTVGHAPNTAYDLTNANVYYPTLAIKLKSDRADGVVLPRNLHIAGLSSSGSVLRYKVVTGATLADGNWIDAGSDSSVLYTLNANTMSGGQDLISGYVSITNQSSTPISLEGGGTVFRYQLERNSFAGTNNTFVIAVAGQKAGDDVFVSVDWEEPT